MKTFMKSKLFSIALSFLMMFAPGLAVGEQHDFDITTADANTGATMRGQINAALQALAGLSSGAAAPVTPYPYQLWADTTTGNLKIRNAANAAWITLWNLSTAPIATVSTQVFTTSGTYTAPAGLAYAHVRLVGGGGGGGGRYTTSGPYTGAGGGAGGYAEGLFTAAQIGASQSVTVPTAAGAGGDNVNGSDGGTASFGALLSATGGKGGVSGGTGGAGGFGSGGDFSTYGNPGQRSVLVSTANLGGPGGGSLLGGGGNGGFNVTAATPAGYGGGGGGASNSAAGSNGSVGIIIITEFKTR